MRDNAVIVDASGVVIQLRPFPGGRDRASPIDLGNGKKMYRLKQAQLGIVQIGWFTVDDGETFSP